MPGNQLEDDEFYGLNIVEKFDDEAMAKHVYSAVGSAHCLVQVINHCIHDISLRRRPKH